MNLLRSCVSPELHDLPHRRASYDRVVHEEASLVFYEALEGIELEHHASRAVGLLGHDEGPLDIPVLHETLGVGDTRDLGVTYCVRSSGVGYGPASTPLAWLFLREPLPNPPPDLVDELRLDGGVGPGD